jgi:conjugative relaxase-like TrwC/TraI family protein
MLSVGKVGMSAAQQLYYEERVAQGREDYYAGRGEAPGRWVGEGARELGLSGELDAEQLKAMMDGLDPATGETLARRGGRASTAAFDMTFSAPKSVSVLFAVGDEQLSRALVEAHEEAVDAAVSYMEREACRVRRGSARQGSICSERAGGFVAAAYRHRMSRAQDPQLHTHVVAANMAKGADGRWTALDGTAIYEHAKAGGFVYEAHLRHAVRERVPWAEWGQVKNGIGELVQVPEGVREEFSTRRRRILERQAELEAAGVSVGHKGREKIAYDTRQAKTKVAEEELAVVEQDWREAVRARAAEHGLDTQQLEALAALAAAEPGREVTVDGLAGRLFSPAGLTATRNTFHDRDVVIGVAEAFRQGAAAGEVLALAGEMVAREQAVEIPDERELDRRYTTAELLDAEKLIVERAREGRGRDAGVVDPADVDGALAGLERGLTGEQEHAIRAIAAGGHRVDTVEALAGTGKTTSAAALRRVYERAGYRVIGAAPTGGAVRELKERAGIGEARTLDAWALKLAADPTTLAFAELTATGVRRQPAVLIIDEAGMAHTRLSARVIDDALEADIKVVAIGDSGQLSSVQAGGWLGALTRELGSHELREVMRQQDPRERRLLAHVHRGEPDEYLAVKTGRGELRVFDGEQPGVDAESAVIDQWAGQAGDLGLAEAVMIARDNDRRERLNQAARHHLQQNDQLGESVEIAGGEWAVGDRVIARRNDRGRDLDNGMRGTIVAVDREREQLVMRADGGGERRLDREYVQQHLEHAYALTGHGMQGGTVTWAAVIGQPADFSRNWSYTALSRARQPTQVYVVDEPGRAQQEREEIAPAQEVAQDRDALAVMGRRMRERDDEDLALEQLEHARDEIEPEQAAGPGADRSPAAGAKSGGRDASPVDEHALTRHVPPIRERVYALGEQLAAVDAQLRSFDPAHAGELARERDRLRRESLELRARAVEEELAGRPAWLTQTLGREPDDRYLKAAWQTAARQTAGWRIDQRITDPAVALGEDPGNDPAYDAVARTLADARRTLEIESARSGQEPVQAAGPRDDNRGRAADADPERVPDPVRALRRPLGPERAARLQERVRPLARLARDRSDAQLRQEREQTLPALAALDGAGAYEARRLEQAIERALDRHRDATGRAGELERQAERLGWRDRRRRDQLRAEANVQRRTAEQADRQLADARRREQELREQGRHPDDWLDRHGDHAAVALAAEHELAVRHERSIQAQAERAIEDPGRHIHRTIGERPDQPGEQRQRWEQLARDLERHRLQYQLDVEHGTPLGPADAPAGAARSEYRRERDQLARRVRDLRSERQLPPLEADAPDLGLDR